MKKNLFAFMLIALFSNTSLASAKVIIHPSVEAERLDAQSLSRIYAMQLKSWENGEPIRVFVFPSRSKLHRSFIISKLKMQPHQLDRLWNRLIFTGIGRAPTVVKSEAEMLKKIQTTPGAIGYIGEKAKVKGVKVVHMGIQDE
ncbi:type 2 periplasmic-binding domain-containing protein [Thiomicrorhabdus lithotrophica]|uniref:PBP domain-containing protein n=1 Tax=Thiomicrorhabdus lithotrophica TaxID=2949997 RepID=A0ABY8C9T0_9GAMM|nr:hypothetical protein [Thiomicrorhabdus lithotrophica]WEJ62292.1 hypothetical protein NR989_09755 [Thiomicrorhabdus lithotrophica]